MCGPLFYQAAPGWSQIDLTLTKRIKIILELDKIEKKRRLISQLWTHESTVTAELCRV